MKRIYIALALLAVITVGCVAAIMMEQHHLQNMIALTEDMERCFRDGDTEQTSALAEKLVNEFPEKTRPFALFLHHSVLADIEECIVLLPLYLQSDEQDDFLAEVTRCRLLLKKQMELEKPNWENIF